MSRDGAVAHRRATRLAVIAGVAATIAACVPSQAAAATQIGQTFVPTGECTNTETELQTGSPEGQYTVPFAGVLTSWSHWATGNQSVLDFKVARPAGGNNFTILAEDGPRIISRDTLGTFPLQIPVQAGDVIGLHAEFGSGCRAAGGPGYTTHLTAGDPAPGTTATFTPAPGVKLDVSATLEPDCDQDGLGDETQDPGLTTPNCPQPPAPEPLPQAKADGTLTIDANKGKVEKGRKVTLTGQYDTPANEACESGRVVEIQRRLKSEDDSKFATFEIVKTDATGNYSTKVKVTKTFFYRAVVAETDACDDETSNSQKVRVQKKKAAQEA